MTKKHVVVLMGGMSTEHEVSIASGTKAAESLDREKYRTTPVVIGKDGLWSFAGERPIDVFDAIPELKKRGVDCALIALHGAFGEDGKLQGMLDLLHIPYTSSGCAASALAMDKVRCKALVRDAGIRVARETVFCARDWERNTDSVVAEIGSAIGYPCAVKAPCQGSSVGMAIPRNEDELRNVVPGILEIEPRCMAEQYVSGVEVTCAVLDIDPSRTPVALPVTEIRPQTSSFFDYEAKYTPGASIEITPAEIPADIAEAIQRGAERIHALVGCGIWSRNDFIIGPEGPVWLEINTVPGLTPTSLFPQAAAATGISYSTLMGMFIEAAMANGQAR